MLLVGQNSRFLLGRTLQNSAAQWWVILRFGPRIWGIGVRIITKRLELGICYIMWVLGGRQKVIVIILTKKFELTHFSLEFLFPGGTARVSIPIGHFLSLNKRLDVLLSLILHFLQVLYTPQLLIKIVAYSWVVLILQNLFLLVNFPGHLLVHDAIGA